MTPEGRVKKKLRDFFTAQAPHCVAIVPVTAGFGVSGWPDYIGCYKGRFFGVEAKARGGKMTALQYHKMLQIEAAGGKHWVIDETNIDQFPVMFLAWASNADME